MRIFVAIKADDNIRELALEIKKKVPVDVRWTPPENLHITLIPPWDEKEPNIQGVADKLEKISAPNISLAFKKCSFGPSSRNPRLIWITADSCEMLNGLKNDIERTLGFIVPERKFIPHITIARFRAECFRDFPTKEFDLAIDQEMKISGFSLIRSILTSKGAVYSTIRDFT